MDIASLCQTSDVHPHFKMQPSPVSTQSSPGLRRQSTSDQPQARPQLPTPTSSMGIKSLLNDAPIVRRSSHSSNPDSPDRKSESNESRSTSASYAETVMTQYSDSTSPSSKRKAEDDLTPVETQRKRSRVIDQPVARETRAAQPPSSHPVKQLPPRIPKPIWAQSWLEREREQRRDRGKNSPRRQPAVVQSPTPHQDNVAEFEPSIMNSVPPDVIINQVSDFIYLNIMSKDATAIQTAHQGICLEIEAKLGHLIDRSTNQRLQLPITGETIIDTHRNPDLRLAFESSMTEAQHRHLNQTLNKALMESLQKSSADGSQAPPKTRSAIKYTHTKETDDFHGLTPEGVAKLPPFMRDRRKAPSVRITRPQGGDRNKILAMIVKSRVADIDIFCPESPVDCRISINYEMRYDGSMDDLLASESGPNERPIRNKDRMSYKHQACQIDLTQVTLEGMKAGPTPKTSKKEHELEIELAVDEARKHASLLLAQKPNSYHALISAFCNNIRSLGRELKNAREKQPATPTK